jgi:outer membrane immunogenic protein
MKKLLLGSVALVALGTVAPAIAADFAVPRHVAYVGGTNWTGCHVGGDFGTAWGNSPGYTTTGQSIAPATGFVFSSGQQVTQNFGMTGFNGGFYGGCDYQFGAWVVGVEGDWSVANKEGQGYAVPTLQNTGGTFVFAQPTQYQMQERWFSTIRGRLGYAVDKWLLYATGGVAFARIDSSAACIFSTTTGQAGGTPPTPCAPNSSSIFQTDNRTGYAVGAGIEYGLSYGWSVRSEYLYVAFPSYTTFTPGTTVPSPGIYPTYLSTKLTNNIYRFGLTYKFGDYAAAAVTK